MNYVQVGFQLVLLFLEVLGKVSRLDAQLLFGSRAARGNCMVFLDIQGIEARYRGQVELEAPLGLFILVQKVFIREELDKRRVVTRWREQHALGSRRVAPADRGIFN